MDLRNPASTDLTTGPGEINGKARGVKADGTDQYALIQSLIVEAATVGPNAVRLPPGNIYISHPLEVTTNGAKLSGTGTFIYAQFYGPSILVGGIRFAPYPTGASLATGIGASLSVETISTQIALSVYSGMNFNLLAEFTAETFFKPASNQVNYSRDVIFGSSGALIANQPKGAFRVFREGTVAGVGPAGTIFMTWRKQDGTNATITGSVILLSGVTYHIAVVVNAGTVTLYCNGVAQGSFSEAGLKVKQEKYEEITLGAGNEAPGFYLGIINYNGVIGLFDSVRFSNTARYTAGFATPTTKFASDASTLLLLNGEVDLNWIIGRQGAANGKVFIYGYQPGTAIGAATVENLGLIGGGIITNGSQASIYRNLSIQYVWTGISMVVGFQSRVQDCSFGFVGRMAILLREQNEEMTIDRVNIQGGMYPFVVQGAAGGIFSNISISPDATTDINFMLRGADMTLVHYQIDDEGQAGAVQAGFMIQTGGCCNIVGGQLDFGSGPYVPFWIDAGGPVNIIGASLYNAVGLPEIVKVTGTAPAINLLGCYAQNSAPLTLSSAAITGIGCYNITNVLNIDRVKSPILSLTLLSSPTTPDVQVYGTGGTTTWTYKVVAKLSDGTPSAASPAGTTTIGNATLTGVNFNYVTVPAVAGAVSYDFYRTVAGTTPATLGKIGNRTLPALVDVALAGDGTTAPTGNSTASIVSTGTNASISITPSGSGGIIANGLLGIGAPAPTIASSGTITPTTSIVFISGTTAIATITAPAPISTGGGTITLIPTGIFTTTTAGNIALASTAVVSKALTMSFDVTENKWYPGY